MSPIEWIPILLSIPGAIASTLALLQAIKEHKHGGKKELKGWDIPVHKKSQ